MTKPTTAAPAAPAAPTAPAAALSAILAALSPDDISTLIFAFAGAKPAPSAPPALAPTAGVMLGKHCVIRTFSAGVHIGTVAAHDGEEVLLCDARRIFQWHGAFTLSEVATKGIDPKESRMAVAIPEVLLTNAVEIIPTTAHARATFDACHEKA